MSKVLKEIEKRGLQTEEDITDFLNGIVGKNIDDLDFKHELTKEEQAEELIYQAMEATPQKGKTLILQAKELDPLHPDIYNYFGDLEKIPEKALEYYEQGVRAGEKKLGKKFFKENEGYFWSMIETRPYMRSLYNSACYLSVLNRNEESLKRFFRILELNPNDNMGARYELFSVSLRINAFKVIEALLKEYRDEYASHWTYNKVLYHFKKGELKKAERELEMAVNTNRHIPRYLLGKTKLPKKLPEYIRIGYADEAVSYVAENIHLWEETAGSLEFMASRI